MSNRYSILVMGASYGSLFATKALLAGHDATLVCTPATAELINREGTMVRFPIRGRETPIDIYSSNLEPELRATVPEDSSPEGFDLVVLAMQEAQYGAPGVRELLKQVAKQKTPCLAVMNMPPLPYLERIPKLSVEPLRQCFVEPSLWSDFEPGLVTLASPDPQAYRPPDGPKNHLHVGLPTNFKTAPFENEEHTEMLRNLEADIAAVRYDPGDGLLEVPVKLRVYESLFVPLAKWPMLVSGNYRCIKLDEMISIRDAVHGDLDASREAYSWAEQLCVELGAADTDLVPFEKYAKAAEGLGKPSSAARALFGGAEYIERVDCLIRRIALQQDLRSDTVDEIVRLVDDRLEKNRAGN